MIFLRRMQLPLIAALLLALPSVTLAAKAKKHPAPKHPEAQHAKPDHPKADHPKPQKAVAHKGPHATRHTAKKSRVKRKRGQQAIDTGRAKEIQEALVREHYLNGQPSGTWDANTQSAMRRYQADQGWQTKEVPDSRALIRLGLGPDHGKLLNPESAMTTGPVARATPGSSAPPAATASASTSALATQSSRVNSPATVLTPSR
jgi:hypothetical protein